MALRIRRDGRILCAAIHPKKHGDTYLHDGISYKLTVELGAIVTEPMNNTKGRGGHAKHGEWWWANKVPKDVVVEEMGKGGMNFCKKVNSEYICTAAAKSQRHCEHSVMERWEVFCQWCDHPNICGLGREICKDPCA